MSLRLDGVSCHVEVDVKSIRRLALSMAVLSSLTLATEVSASEGGGSTYAAGVANFLVAAVPPPPGVFLLGYGDVYHASRLRDGDGNVLPIPDFKLAATAVSPRLIWDAKAEVLGGNPVLHATLPLVELSVTAAGLRQSKRGLGDITLGAGLAYHHGEKLHSVIALDVVAPTGSYRAGDLANIGRNYWSLQPLYAMSRVDPDGLNADFKAVLNMNRRNPDTDYRSGTEFIFDYALGWGLGNGWVVGAGGSVAEQLSDDRVGDMRLANSRSRLFAIGPSLKYQGRDGGFFTLKWQREMAVRNRPEGAAVWIVASLPF
jgi:hypothetical protein